MKLGWRRPPLAPDAAAIRTLAGLLSETGLTEIEYWVGDHRIQSQGRNEPSDLLQMSMGGKARGFTRLGSNIQDENALRRSGEDRFRHRG